MDPILSISTRIAVSHSHEPSADHNLPPLPPPPITKLKTNRRKRVVLHHMNFKGKVVDCKFSPCGRSFAVCVGKLIQIWATPTMLKEFAPFRLLRTYGGGAVHVEGYS